LATAGKKTVDRVQAANQDNGKKNYIQKNEEVLGLLKFAYRTQNH